MRRIVVVSLSLIVGAAASAGVVHAQEVVATVDPGMTRSQVIERLGQPASERTRGEHTYLFFQNGCERQCGMSDLVMLRADTVIDAIFRSSQRRYSGTSSSPTARAPEAARTRSTAAPLAVPSRATDVGTPEPVRAQAEMPAAGDERASSRSSVPATTEPAPATVPVVSPASSTPAQTAVATPAMAVWPPAGAEPVRASASADTIKGSPEAKASTWPPPAVKAAADSAARAARAADSTAAAQAARERATMTTWPPPRVKSPADTGAAPPKPPED